MTSQTYMQRALALAAKAAARGEVPVGAVLVDGASGEVVAEAFNQVETLRDITAHAEMLVLKEAMFLKSSSPLGGEQLRSSPKGEDRNVGAKKALHTPHDSSGTSNEVCSHRLPPKGGVRTNVNNEDKYLSGYDLYVTLEPCAMCAGAISHGRIRRLIFGAYDPKSGGVEHGPCVFKHATTHHKPEIIGGVMEAECSALLTKFFKERR